MQQFTGTFIYRHLDIQRDLPALVSLLEDVEQAAAITYLKPLYANN